MKSEIDCARRLLGSSTLCLAVQLSCNGIPVEDASEVLPSQRVGGPGEGWVQRWCCSKSKTSAWLTGCRIQSVASGSFCTVKFQDDKNRRFSPIAAGWSIYRFLFLANHRHVSAVDGIQMRTPLPSPPKLQFGTGREWLTLRFLCSKPHLEVVARFESDTDDEIRDFDTQPPKNTRQPSRFSVSPTDFRAGTTQTCCST